MGQVSKRECQRGRGGLRSRRVHDEDVARRHGHVEIEIGRDAFHDRRHGCLRRVGLGDAEERRHHAADCSLSLGVEATLPGWKSRS